MPLLDCQKLNVSLAQAKYSKYNLSNCSCLIFVGSSKLNSRFFTNSAIRKQNMFKYLNLLEDLIPPLNKLGGLLEQFL